MKKTHKKVFGLLGLVLVAAMTIAAAFMPTPGASAATSTSFSDNISVRVIDEVPSVTIVSPTSGEEVISRDDPIQVSYTNLSHYTVTITYTDESGVEHTEVLEDVDPTESSGDLTYDFRPIAEQYGYGNYKVTFTGVGVDGSEVSDSVAFEYIAAEAEIKEAEEGGVENPSEIEIDLNYDDDDTLPEDERVAEIRVEVFDDNGNPVAEIPVITVYPPEKKVTIDFDKYGVPSGYYTIVVTPYNAKGEELYRKSSFRVYYDGKIVVPSTADTGGLFKDLNISSTDYLITGLGVFLVVGIGGLVFVGKRNRR